MNIRVFLEWYHDRNSRKSKCLEMESILANLSDEIFGTSCLPRRTRLSRPRSPPPRQRPPKSPASDSIANFTTDYRTVKRHESCHMTDLKIKNFPCMWCSLFDYDHGIQELFSMLILDLFPTCAAVPKIFLISRDSQRTDLTGKIIHGGRPWIKGIVHGPSLNMSEYQVIHN